MDNSEGKECSQCVRVAVNVRPLVTSELLLGCTNCVTLVPGEPQVQIGSHSFTFDYVFSDNGLPSTRIFNECVAPLVDALFHGYNATVLAYGQTGSGKTYTMGTNYNGEDHSGGIIPMVMETIFSKVETTRRSTEYLIRVSFIEIFKEEVFDLLLDQSPPALCRGDGTSLAKTSAPARVPIQIRETMNGGITLAGVTEAEVRTKEEMASFLLRGSLTRATGSTNMNSQSSRSHAIFTITMEQKKISRVGANHSDGGDDILCAKLHLVDLAGSERAKRTGADGVRLREGIHINKGLLALGNVISALGDEKKRKEGGHVPYRDSKLTRLLQDSLGGNSKTVMIACVSPADTNAEESLNTLKYANRARNIQNKAVVNRDPMAAQMQMMRSQIEALQAELDFFRGDSGASYEELQILKHKISLLEASNAELHRELQENRMASEHLRQRALDAQVEKDKLLMKIESARKSNSWDEFDSKSDQDFDMVKAYVSKIQELEGELLRLQNLNNSKELKHREFVVDCLELDGNGLRSNLRELSDMNDIGVSGEAEVEVKELEHSSLQEKLDRELKELDKRLEQKEAEMKRFGGAETSVLKQHYEKKVHELELEKRALQKEIEDLRHSLSNISSNPDEGAQKLKENYLQKLNALETQVAELRKKQDAQAQILRQKQKSDEAAKRLQEEIHKIKTQKVQLQNKIKQESEQFRHWKASREKEVLQLKKEGRRNEYEMHKLLALNQRQKMVLQRKTEEASMATKRLKELLESRKASSRDTLGAGNGHGSQALMQAIEHDLEVTVRVYEVRSEYERQLEERARMAKELAELKEIAQNLSQTNLSGGPQAMLPGARNSRIYALENMLATSSSNLVSMASHLSEAEERERAFSGRGRFNQVRTLAEAKIIMNFLFNLASSSRCHSWDKEVDCKEKDLEIKELKEKVVNMVRQMELQKRALNHMEQLQKLNMKEGHVYDLRPKGMRSSIAYNAQPMEDMDTSNSEHSDMDAADEWVHSDTDPEWEASRKRQPRRRNPRTDSRSGTSMDSNGSENMKLELGDDITDAASGNCCSCSKSSSCKTMRCECRAGGASCRSLCGCVSSKCSNRDPALPPLAAFEQLLQQQEQHVERTNETEKSLVTHGASLLQNALSERTRERNGGDESRRKPLSDIGNVAKPNAPKSTQRKKWRKSVIQLVPVAPTPQPEAPPPRQENMSNAAAGNEIPLQLPRAMRSTSLDSSSSSSSSNLLRERNSGYASSEDVSLVNKDNGGGGTQAASSRSSSVQKQPRRDEKENRGL